MRLEPHPLILPVYLSTSDDNELITKRYNYHSNALLTHVNTQLSCLTASIAPQGDRTKWYRTKWHGQNGTDKMVYGQNAMGQNGMDKMVWTKWYGQNGSNFSYRL